MKPAKNYDTRCLDLAKVFLADEFPSDRWDEDADELAALIQQTIEDWIQYGRCPKAPPPKQPDDADNWCPGV